MEAKKPENSLTKAFPGALPRPPKPGPDGLSARLATVRDEPLLLALLGRAASERGLAWDEDRTAWAVQCWLRDAARGFFVLAQDDSPSGSRSGAVKRADRFAGIASLAIWLDPLRGSTGDLFVHWLQASRDSERARRWFLSEVFELARYHGVNRLRLAGLPRDWHDAVPSGDGGRSETVPATLEVTLPPHFAEADEGNS